MVAGAVEALTISEKKLKIASFGPTLLSSRTLEASVVL